MGSSPQRTEPASLPPILALPAKAFTRSGIAFDPNADVWSWIDGVFQIKMDFGRLQLPVSAHVISLKYTLHLFARLNAPTYVVNLFNAFVHFLALRQGMPPLAEISALEVSNYFSRLGSHEKWRLGALNVLLQKWHALKLPGVDAECAKYLREKRKIGNCKGKAVRQRDPVSGPFSEDEYTSLYKAVDVAYGRGEVSLWVLVLTRLLFACGGRISQYASLKVLDLETVDGAFVLKLPQVKTGLEHSRATFIEFTLSPQTGRLVLELIEGLRISGCDEDAPLFLEDEVLPIGWRRHRRADTDTFLGHCTQQALSRAFIRIVSPIAPRSARLDFERIPVSPQRFRSTFGTRLAEEGASKAEIANRLGHVDLQNVEVYFEASPKIVESIDTKIGKQLAPLARAFRGRVIDDEIRAANSGDAVGRIIDFRVSAKTLASCAGKAGTCSFEKPVACYTCFRFEPWLDGPHEAVLSRLEQERAMWTSDPRMAAVNDVVITAVREVIAECSLIREQRAAAGGK